MKASLFALLALTILLGVSCSHNSSAPSKPAEPTPPAAPPTAGAKGTVDFQGVHLTNDEAVASDVKPEIVQATPLEDAGDEPDDNWPEHVRLSFSPPQGKEGHDTSFQAELRVVSVPEYRKTYQVDPHYVENLEKDIAALKKRIDDPASTGEIPFLPFVDAQQAFANHVTRIEFTGGKGIGFLTQYNIEPALVNNDALTWIFQGFTNDGQKYIVATFPVSCSAAAPNGDPEQSHRGYQLPKFFYKDKTNQKQYDAYLEGAKNELAGLSPDKFQPNLTTLEKMIRSLRVDQ